MIYRITTTARAEADVERHFAWLSEQPWGDPDRWYASYVDAIDRVRTRPLTCGLAFEDGSIEEELRHLLFGPKGRKYRALFVVRADEVVVLAVRAPGERPVAPEELDDRP
jgi:hypothetical protein